MVETKRDVDVIYEKIGPLERKMGFVQELVRQANAGAFPGWDRLSGGPWLPKEINGYEFKRVDARSISEGSAIVRIVGDWKSLKVAYCVRPHYPSLFPSSDYIYRSFKEVYTFSPEENCSTRHVECALGDLPVEGTYLKFEKPAARLSMKDRVRRSLAKSLFGIEVPIRDPEAWPTVCELRKIPAERL